MSEENLFPDLICSTCNSALEETGQVVPTFTADYVVCKKCKTYFLMQLQDNTVFLTYVYREGDPLPEPLTLQEKIEKANTPRQFIDSLKL